MFQQSMPPCAKCPAQNYSNLDKFINNKCDCDLGLINNREKASKEAIDTKGNSLSVRHLNSEHSSQEYKSDDDKQIFRPKFGRHKNVNRNVQPIISTPLVEEVDFVKEDDENKAHKSNVAKITFKTAKEQLLASNPAIKRTLGTSRKAQAKFVSPMIGAQ